MFHRMRELAERGGDQPLTLFPGRLHAVLLNGGGATDQDHRPAILIGVRETGEAMHGACANYSDRCVHELLPCKLADIRESLNRRMPCDDPVGSRELM